MVKFFLTLFAFFYTFGALATAFQCEAQGSKTVLQVELATNPLDAQATRIEVHAYLDSVDFGRGDVIGNQELVAENQADSGAEVPMDYTNGMRLLINKKTKDQCLFPVGFIKDINSIEEILCCRAI